ncbi:MAG: 2-iminobutanoate/2-iminopropanoate deaminase [Saprospiraceae bacterium]|jgi:2-iminobutanoate/2-iminopropanoate deaminase
MKKIPIVTNAAPPSIGTHTQALRVGNLVFTTGQTGRDPDSGMLKEGIAAQTHQMLKNIEAILNAAGCSPADIVKVTLLLIDLKTFKEVDHIYAKWLPDRGEAPLPVRTASVVSELPAGALVMLDVIANYPG